MQNLLWLSLAGAAGTLCRYGLASLVQRLVDRPVPLGTLAVNVLGCLLFGLVWGLTETRTPLSVQARLIVLTGFMGAFTTFSRFACETSILMRERDWLAALGNLALQNVLGVASFFLGLLAARWF